MKSKDSKIKQRLLLTAIFQSMLLISSAYASFIPKAHAANDEHTQGSRISFISEKTKSSN